MSDGPATSHYGCCNKLACVQPQAAVSPILIQLPRFSKTVTVVPIGTTLTDAAARSGPARTFAVCLTTIFSIALGAAEVEAGAETDMGAGAAADGTTWGRVDTGVELVLGRSALTIDTAGVDEITAMGAEVSFGRARLEIGP